MIGGNRTPHLKDRPLSERFADSLAGVPRLDNALCAVVEPDVFFPERGGKAAADLARRICAGCPVARSCLAAAMEAEGDAGHAKRFGIWGGTSPEERHRLYERGIQGKDGDLSVTDPDPEITPVPEPDLVAPVRAMRQTAKCGTRSGYSRHRRAGEPVCDPCRYANAAADRRLRTSGSSKAVAA